MTTFYDPVSLLTTIGLSSGAASGIATGLQVVGALGGAAQAIVGSQSEAAFLESQAKAERLQRSRDIRDEEETNRIRLGRLRAVLAGQGVSLGEATAIGLLAAEEGDSLVRRQRIKTDSRIREQSLLAKAKQTEQAGAAEAALNVFGGAATFLESGAKSTVED